MTQTSDADRMNPEEIAAQAAAFARHLQHSGVSFLPTPNSEGVNRWMGRMQPVLPNEPGSKEPASETPASKAREPGSAAMPAPTRTGPTPSLLAEVQQPYPGDSLAHEERVANLNVLQQRVADCTRCSQLAQCRTMTVFGEGSAMPRVAFFGEGPGADEDRSGRPFVGKAGQLLTKMIEACKMQREDVYILNTVKCRPPGNRNPEPEEVSNCREYFEQQLAILRPEYIVCLGAVASQSLLNSKLSVGRLRGQFHQYFESKVIVTYHPAYLLRNPSAKKAAWQDLQMMLQDAGLI